MSSQVADGLARRGAADSQQQEDVPSAVLEVPPEAMRGLSFQRRQIDRRPTHQVILVAFVAIPDRDLELLT